MWVILCVTSTVNRPIVGSKTSTGGSNRIMNTKTEWEQPPVHARSHEYSILTLCLRLVVAITNYGRGVDPGREKLKL